MLSPPLRKDGSTPVAPPPAAESRGDSTQPSILPQSAEQDGMKRLAATVGEA